MGIRYWQLLHPAEKNLATGKNKHLVAIVASKVL
jgi:hypothetical protein